MSAFIDTHTHIYLDDFAADRDDVIRRAQDAGATRLLLPNIDEASLESMLRLCAEWPLLCCPMIGLHPTELPADPWPALKRMEHRLSTEAGRFVAVGEVGLDFYWDNSRRGEQIAVFRKQAEWAIRVRPTASWSIRCAPCPTGSRAAYFTVSAARRTRRASCCPSRASHSAWAAS